MIHAIIKEVGTAAFSEKEPLLILFDQSATAALRNYSIIQEITSEVAFSLQIGDSISFDEQEYLIEHIGPLANDNLTTVGHSTLIFGQQSEENKIANGIYLSPYQLPKIKVGTKIVYKQVN
ncbi:hypothetical protein A5844_001978 [Enterococcus sp. 10A9_DIV0425]|uniref:PTS sorbitol transporter subunit IIA n=1 Tax=Candidatus Enterococcus wittei TaxID=1987383 RepID=A0A242JYT2_9ENTE|nr:PTS glucitol/sorbitol transporter subunit IIA [Enterococcus sp. 10A9_DIV0425]OTP10279.1 hypothetical protein A5844_001978 [Enterococcus sp. 10A9_DIV0425]THE10897.1 PTS sorbitol transporter subunit IIA [Enterococcus hirae]